MIENIVTRRMWAYSPDDAQAAYSTTIHLNTNSFRRPRVTAQTALSRVMGNGAAKAYISSMEQQRGDSAPVTVPLEPPASAGLPKWIAGVSQYSLNDVASVTFGLLVSNMFAYATCTVFVYQPRSLLDTIVRPFRYLGDLITEREAPDQMQMGGKDAQTALVYSKATGQVVHIHQTTWMPGASIPTESQLRSAALTLAGTPASRPESDLDVLFTAEELSPEKHYSVDVKGRRLIAS